MLRVFTAFSGYDSQCLALNRANIAYELVGWSEIDKFAIKAHNALFPQWSDRNFGDISQIDWSQVPDFDLFTYSSPCQDFSNAGKMKGGEKGSGTRSSLLWECEKPIRAKMPKHLLLENVANLVSKKFIGTFQNWLNVLSELGYTNYWQVLNAKDYGVPQNRKRVFVVSILNSQEPYYFPKPVQTDIKLKDVLEGYVDKKYYLSEKLIHCLESHAIRHGGRGKDFAWNPTDGNTIAHTLSGSTGCRPKDNYIEEQQVFVGPINDQDGACRTIKAQYSKTSRANLIRQDSLGSTGVTVMPANTKDGYVECEVGGVIYISYPNSKTRRGRVQNGGNLTPTLTCNTENNLVRIENNYRIRKLTERECFRLMGVADSESDKIRQVVSKTRCYKLAGNSIVVDVLVAIFNQLFSDNKTTDKQLKLF